jgi:ribonuclease BN (tRNA processing enzyme)
MNIQVLGGHGGKAQGFETTSFLIDSKLLIDAGGVAGTLSIEEQKKIDHILITHTHLDHIKDLAFICDNCFGLRTSPFEVFTHATVHRSIKNHLLNDVIWPDFTKLPSAERPTIRFTEITPEKVFKVAGYEITPVKVKHALDAMGYIVNDGKVAVLFSGDTGPTDRIWEIARQVKNLKAIFTEVSFPNFLQQVADASEHHTANTMKAELVKMPKDVPVILTHLKPNYQKQVFQEIKSLGDSRIHVLERDGELFSYTDAV